MQLFQAELRAAIGQGDRCTLCQLVAAADRHHMRSFLREHSSDPLVLAPIYAAWGFCAWHAWALALMEDTERGGVLAMALLADDLLRHLAAFFVTASESATLPVPPSPGLDTNCTMCLAMGEQERYWVKRLTAVGTSSADDLAESPRFCEPHLRVLKDASGARSHIVSGWRVMLRRMRRAPQQAHDAVSLLPLADNAGTLDQAVARTCGVRGLSPHFCRMGDALAPLDDASSRPSGGDPVTCAVCTAEISAARAACERLLTVRPAIGAAEVAASGLCRGHRWLLADMMEFIEYGESIAQIQNATARPLIAARSLCVICHTCWDAASETLRAGACSAAIDDCDTGRLCLAHWSAAERILSERGQELARLSLRHAQRHLLEAAREDLRRYLDYFSVSTRDHTAPPPTTFAWRQALTLLFGMRPQGQCRAYEN